MRGALLFLAVVFVSHASAAGWKAGLSRTNITPQHSMWMSGYGARDQPAQGKLTDLYAKCLALEDPAGQRVVLITMDLVGIDRTVASNVTATIGVSWKLARESILLSTSHTHTGPVVGENLRAMYFLDGAQEELVDQYTALLQTQLVALAGSALRQLEPATLSWGTGRAAFGVNRRQNRENEVQSLRADGQLKGPRDHDVPVLAVHDGQKRLRALVTGYACHATVLSSLEWSGDWPGFAQIELEKRHPGAMALVWAGCGADQNPLPRRQVVLAQQYGAELADAVDRVLNRGVRLIEGSLGTRYQEIPLSFTNLPTRADLERNLKSTNRYETNRAGLLLKQLADGAALPSQYPYPVQAWKLGNGPAWVALGGEVVVDYGLRLKQEHGPGIWVMGYANDVMAYIPSERVLAEGGYEGGGAMVYYGQPGPWATGIEERIVREVGRQLQSLGWPAAPRSFIYPDHSDLSVYFDSSSRPQVITNRVGWEKRREQIVEGFQAAAGKLPDLKTLPALDLRVEKVERTDSYERRLISYQSEPGNRVPAYLLIPFSTATPKPAMLCLHQTVAIGKGEVVGLGNKGNLRYADELARRGYVCLAPDYPSFGDYKNYDFAKGPYPSGTMQGIVNHLRAVDALAAMPEVDAQRMGVIGHSLGGHNAMFAALFDLRLKVVVSSCGWTPFHDYYQGKIAGWTSDRYMPRLRSEFDLNPDRVPFDFHEVVAALAPRAFFSNSPVEDANFAVSGVRKAISVAKPIYRLYDVEKNLQVRYPESGHDFPPEIREEAYAFVDGILQPRTKL